MQTAIATVSLSGALNEKLEAIAAARFKGVEIFENDLLSFDGTPADVRAMVAGLGLRSVTFQPFRDFEGMPADRRDRIFARAERKFDVMQELGCDLLLVCSNVSPESLGGIERAAADLRALGERAARRGLRVGFEALAWGRHINDYRDAWEAVRRADHPAIGLVLDTFHILARKTDLGAIAAIPRDRIFLVQVADAPVLDMDYLSWSRHFRNFPGQGDLPLLDYMAALQATGYDALLSLEIFNDQFRAGSARSVAVDGHRSLIYLMDQLQAHTGVMDQSAPPLPPRARCQGTEFIEFAIDEGDAPSFRQMLAGLGFRCRGIHKSKAVERWRQGDINLVINSEKEGFAHSYNIVHGTAVCAIGLNVEDAAATLDRARRLLDTPFQQAVGPGELEVPAVRGLGGSLLYFIDHKTDLARVWDIEFDVPTYEGPDTAVGLTRVDHISQSMQYEEMLTWLLFYTSLLDVTKTSEQDVVDPGGLTKSRVVQAADGGIRIVLNASQSNRTLSSRFLSEMFGSGVQHIAFATDDILQTAARLAANGVDVLPIPENYYDDLEAKSDLTPALIAQLKAHNVLYDREGGAEYLQIYVQATEQRFFFEIVERRGYTGFGAANAPIRLAAQTRFVRQSHHL
ncbi:bifunctional sugar phosphate isomerase/epimerase/4-hydroxyphenylpyruvate dioxygenase family protein [Reyranella sp. CPCC 100927]|uniref:bifunctional sugar phosphate isomerase/epimerase/4-hydroxyphenylpyruvate dioxygenase family protein n=1 Tax=Reyranella sp. CPCC 100927 TaxID=2599616 RepID=UPI0011B85667|nr:sugar phosphate isomerase/epimerase and 4-hydroxyphenylpyruvate domain-containing protein [Reyranella sp. CPCC 100927]TWT12851.1 sugar phosphate isomerase/epimerase and 4-hydroxyphenylpyruvate domain-containing protein [Reyranella sp. CPCC 100927]